MMKRLATLVLLLAIGAGISLAGPAAHADAATGCGAPQQRVNAALASLHFPWRTLGYRYVAMPARTDGTLGMTFTGPKRTEIYVQPCSQESSTLLRHVVAHEVGHAIAMSWTTPAQHRAWDKARHLSAATPWLTCDRCPVWDSAEGDFVEVFSFWQTGQFRSDITSAPTRAQLKALIKLIPTS